MLLTWSTIIGLSHQLLNERIVVCIASRPNIFRFYNKFLYDISHSVVANCNYAHKTNYILNNIGFRLVTDDHEQNKKRTYLQREVDAGMNFFYEPNHYVNLIICLNISTTLDCTTIIRGCISRYAFVNYGMIL